MKVILQRVTKANVKVANEKIGEINHGYVLLLGIGGQDTHEIADKMINKIKNLRLFADDTGKTNLSINDVNGEVLIISQFTLYADCRKGNRPSFTEAAPPALAEALYTYFIKASKPHFTKIAHGQFAASMQVELVNDGPFTVVLEMG
ncbi:MAG: D-aminoacyl-tRNA deacylase [Defluviitaleaceae bacterium]|nr:D-aminoacyl-tRNA deacylase [Defluviitaleaceae bacterium]